MTYTSGRKFDIPKMEADCQCLSFDKVNNDIELPDFAAQDELIMTYFSYVHHIFPVVHKASFLGIYNERYALISMSSALAQRLFYTSGDSTYLTKPSRIIKSASRCRLSRNFCLWQCSPRLLTIFHPLETRNHTSLQIPMR